MQKEGISNIITTYRYYSDKRFTTISGTLVYFFLMSLTPFLFLLSLMFGDVDLSSVTSLPVLSAVEPVLSELQAAASSATSGVSVVLIATTLYSSTNFFYHLKRSGEIIYNCKSEKGGIKIRIFSLFLIIITVLMTFFAVSALIFGKKILLKIVNHITAEVVIYAAAFCALILVAMLLNLFICPYKIRPARVISGSLLTTLLWLLCGTGFLVYLKFSNLEKLYGKVASFIVFLLWCYLMMNSFVIGVIHNGRYSANAKSAKLIVNYQRYKTYSREI